MEEERGKATKLEYYENMWKLISEGRLVLQLQTEDNREALVLDSTIFHPQGGGQPSDTGFIILPNSSFSFVVQDVRSINGVVYHYGHSQNSQAIQIETGTMLELHVDESRRNLNSRLHSAGHLLDICIRNVGLEHLDSHKGKGYHFPHGPFVEYKGTIPQTHLQIKLEELERNANALIQTGGKVYAALLPYQQAAEVCGGHLPDYIAKGSNPRIVKLGENLGCPCGGTHVRDISDIRSIKCSNKSNGPSICTFKELIECVKELRFARNFYTISQIRTKKGMTKISYQISD